MELFEFPVREIWDERKAWIENEIDQSMTGFSYMVSDHATALFADLQACYCIGAWLSVVILSISVLDAHLRETEAMDDRIGTAKLLDEFYYGDDDINWLRKLRNKYVHIDMANPILEMNHQWTKREQMRGDAKRAIEIVISALFQSPGT